MIALMEGPTVPLRKYKKMRKTLARLVKAYDDHWEVQNSPQIGFSAEDILKVENRLSVARHKADKLLKETR